MGRRGRVGNAKILKSGSVGQDAESGSRNQGINFGVFAHRPAPGCWEYTLYAVVEYKCGTPAPWQVWLVRSGGKWRRSDVFSRFASDPCYGTHRSSVRSSASCRPAVIHGARRGPCITSIRAGIRQGVRAGYVPQVGELAAASPNRRMMASCARGRSLERLRRAGQRQSSLG